MNDHEFGNLSTDLKLSLVERYLKAFTQALDDKFSELWYIDAFAGTGVRTIVHAAIEGGLLGEDTAERIEQRRGSAQIAIDVLPMFDRIVLVEQKKRHYQALLKLVSNYPGRRIDVVRADANKAIISELNQKNWTGKRAVMFLDPYGMAVNWSTLEAIQKTEAIDVWYLVSLSGIFRQATRDPAKLSPDKRAALVRMLGTDEWEQEWYEGRKGFDLLGEFDEAYQRTADVEAIETYVQKRLRTVFPAVLPPKRLFNDRGVPIFALFLAISNPEPKAIGLAKRIGNHILKS
ncbi:three-Cys-motif partner protein TcmP [Phyllobacterium calauticae]|jgi:three-Cys-motif partner protein|uniref:three-Cys-motif partner protein TcmP n=1 Tax=Phyllobacterium calauticae TaxID=2817027 RepID=UPI001CBF24B2|nr:three-Cys-motif partner protein TcmP [Phyllobacterium calauticae]MBZ3691019.1 three-Cys-motif partner protein TcmP [Phyllobacterium calauticae]